MNKIQVWLLTENIISSFSGVIIVNVEIVWRIAETVLYEFLGRFFGESYQFQILGFQLKNETTDDILPGRIIPDNHIIFFRNVPRIYAIS